MQKANDEAGGKFIGYVAMTSLLPAWKLEHPWLKESPSQALQQALKDVEGAYKNFFEKRADFPRFKRKGKGKGEGFRFPQGFKIDQGNQRLFLPKLDWIRYRNSREIAGTAKNVTVSHSGKWYASIQTEREVERPVPVATSAVGLDMGIVRFATLSDGSCISPLGSFKKHERRLKKYQRRMSRKVKFSWRGAILIAAPAHHTSQTCPACGHVAKQSRQTQALFACVDCGHEENADVVGAINVLARGHRVAASAKQEPTEVTIREATHV